MPQDLEARLHLINRLAAERQEVVDDIARGRLGLLEAARRFRDCNDGDPAGDLANLRHAFPGASDDEIYCRQVIHYLEGRRTTLDPEGKLCEGLRAELEERLTANKLTLKN
jgi:hypothetical protein